jgi:dTDP-4-amino-4,6-dideoxygalactose transaminase
MIPRFRPHYNYREILAACKFWQQSAVSDFERSFASQFGQTYAVAFPYGRTGLIGVINALGIKHKGIVMPTYTCVVVAHAIKYSGNEPIFLDSQIGDYNMNLNLLDDLSEPPGAIIATSIFGHPVNLDQLGEVRARWPDVPIIQDCCHSYDAKWQGRPVHKFGVASVFALNISKIINSIFGGMVLTDDQALYQKLIDYRSNYLRPHSITESIKRFFYLIASSLAFIDFVYGLTAFLARRGFLGSLVKYYDEHIINMPEDYLSQITPLQARVGLVQLTKYRQIVHTRKQCAALYADQLSGLKQLRLPPNNSGATYSHYVVECDEAAKLSEYCRLRGVQLGHLIEYNVGDMATYKHRPTGKYDVARGFVGRTLNLPLGDLSDAIAAIKAIKTYFSNDVRE